MKRRLLGLLLMVAISLPMISVGGNLTYSTQENIVVDTFVVCGNCYTCKLRIQGELKKIVGVVEYNWSPEALEITYDNTIITPYEFLETIAAVGHDTEKVKAPALAYNALVGTCCEYDRWLTYEQLESSWAVKSTEECKETLENLIMDFHGILEASWDNDMLNATFYKQITGPKKILNLLAGKGFDNEQFTASDEAYGMLSESCKYRVAEPDTVLNIATSLENQLELYPNPTQNTLYIKGDISNIQSISIVNTSGKVVLALDSDKVNADGIDLSLLPKGVYILNVNQSNSNYSSKIIKN